MDIELILNSFPKLLSASVITLKLLSVSIILGLFIGLLFAILRIKNNPILEKFAYIYSYIFRGTPLLVQIFIIYYGFGQVEFIRDSFLWVILKEPYWCAIIAFALNTGAYTSEILRSAFKQLSQASSKQVRAWEFLIKLFFIKYKFLLQSDNHYLHMEMKLF